MPSVGLLKPVSPCMEFTMIAQPDAACYVGIDLHKETLVACVITAKDREVSSTTIRCNGRNKIHDFFASLPRPSVVAIETVGFYRWLWTELEPIVDQLVLADARGARAPPGSVQRLRNWTRHRNGQSRQHAKVLHHVKSIMNRIGRPGPTRMDGAGLQRSLLAGVERIDADDLTMR